jgi:hypothetical protein
LGTGGASRMRSGARYKSATTSSNSSVNAAPKRMCEGELFRFITLMSAGAASTTRHSVTTMPVRDGARRNEKTGIV